MYYRRNLPHYQPPNATFFVTFRLAGSLPIEVIIKLQEEYAAIEKRLRTITDPEEKTKEIRHHHKRYFEKFDEFLDKHYHGPTWMRDERIAELIATAIQYRNGKEYDLISYCIMPNHVHLVISFVENVEQTSVCSKQNDRTEVQSTAPYQNYELASVLRKLKGSTAREANKILRRSGAFWQHESYDHVVRDAKELDRVIWYVLNNPVKAGLATELGKWRWKYSNFPL